MNLLTKLKTKTLTQYKFFFFLSQEDGRYAFVVKVIDDFTKLKGFLNHAKMHTFLTIF